jgi:hypothetical protein
MLSLGQVHYKKVYDPLSVDLFHLEKKKKKKKNQFITRLGEKP